jgi:hypothetical protein
LGKAGAFARLSRPQPSGYRHHRLRAGGHQPVHRLAVNGAFEKSYVAILCGVPAHPRGTVDAPILRRDIEHLRDISRMVHPDGQRSVTHYEVLASGGGYSLARFVLETGRTHQIRVHMAYLGYPLAGDAMYGGNCTGMSRQALHCAYVSFRHPVDGRALTVRAPLPEDMCSLLRRAGIDPALLTTPERKEIRNETAVYRRRGGQAGCDLVRRVLPAYKREEKN